MSQTTNFEASWEKIYVLYGPVLYNYGCKLTNHQQCIEDCIQDLFTELWEKKYNPENIRQIKPYLIKAFRRKLIQKLQHDHNSKSQQLELAELQFNISFSFESSLIAIEMKEEQKMKVERALQKLSPRQREALFLKFYENHSNEEVADIMRIEKSALYSLVYKGMCQLRTSLKKTSSTAADVNLYMFSLLCSVFLC